MTKYLFLFTIMLFIFNVYSQDIKKKRTSDGDIKESYHVLKSDKNVKHGDYKLKIGGKTIQKGQFDHGKKSGIWIIYAESRKNDFAYNYDTDSIIYDVNSNKLAFYSLGFQYFWYLISKNIKYPAEAREAGKSGRVVVSFSVDIDGRAKDFAVYAGCGNLSLNNEALRVVQIAATEHNWFIRANKEGVKEKVEFLYPVTFRF